MVDDQDLAGLDPYDLMATEAARLDGYFSQCSDADWQRASRCAGWSVRDVLAHLAASEEYNRASLDGTVQQLLGDWGARGATDLTSANEIGIRSFDGRSNGEVLGAWREQVNANREGFRARDGGNVDTSAGEYPARWQAFHLAFELATHADDVDAPVDPSEVADRNAWQARFGRFALKEAKEDVNVEARDGRTRVQLGAVDVELADDEFVAALAARLPAGSQLDAETAAALSVTP
jgi:uncharacterized protein (TIGR03083 family)